MTKKYCIFLSALFCAFLGVFLVANAVSPDRTFSQMENRNLEQLPVPSVKTLLNGQFMKDFETYTTDQFVGRDGWIASSPPPSVSWARKRTTMSILPPVTP